MAKNNHEHKSLKGNGQSRVEQVAVGDKLLALLKKEVQVGFRGPYQGSAKGSVAILVITANSPSLKSKALSYISKQTGFDASKESIVNHGDIAKTIVINLSTTPPGFTKGIESSYKLLFPNGHKKEKAKPIVEAEVPVVVKAPPVEAPKAEEKKRLVSKTVSLSKFLSTMLVHEMMITDPTLDTKDYRLKAFCSHDKKKEDDYNVINCNSLEIAENVEKAINWFYSNNEAIRVDSTVMFKIPDSIEEKKIGINFCLPPSHNSDEDEVRRRLHRVAFGSKPVSIVKGTSSFLVKYLKKNTAPKIFSLLKGMGWDVIKSNDLIYINLLDLTKDENAVTTPTAAEEKLSPAVEPLVRVVDAPVPALNQQGCIPFIHSKEEALEEIERIYSDARLFSRLPKDVQARFVSILKAAYNESHPVEYANTLLEFFKK